MTTSVCVSALLQRWHQDAAKPSCGTDYDTGQYDALMVCISELHAVLVSCSARHDDAAIKAVYEKYQHLNHLVRDDQWADTLRGVMLRECWDAICAAVAEQA